MECDDMFAYYTFINGEVYFSALQIDINKKTRNIQLCLHCSRIP